MARPPCKAQGCSPKTYSEVAWWKLSRSVTKIQNKINCWKIWIGWQIGGNDWTVDSDRFGPLVQNLAFLGIIMHHTKHVSMYCLWWIFIKISQFHFFEDHLTSFTFFPFLLLHSSEAQGSRLVKAAQGCSRLKAAQGHSRRLKAAQGYSPLGQGFPLLAQLQGLASVSAQLPGTSYNFT